MSEPEDKIDDAEVEETQTPQEGDDEFVVEPGAVDDSVPESAPAANPEEKNDEEESSEDAPVEPSDTDEAEIDGVKYSKEDLSRIFEVGKRVADYQKEHPGYDPVLIHKDYTQKTQELAEIKRKIASPVEQQVKAPSAGQPDVDISDVKKEDLEYFERIAKASGYVKRSDLEERERQHKVLTYEEAKKVQLKTFLNSHPEYLPENDPGDVRWTTLRQEFDLYKIPEDPHQIGVILERVHRSVAGTSSNFDPKKVAEIIAKKKSNASGQSSSGGGSGATVVTLKAQSSQQKRVADLALKGGLRGFSAKELEELLN